MRTLVEQIREELDEATTTSFMVETIRHRWATEVLDAWAAENSTYWYTITVDITTYVKAPWVILGSGIGSDAARFATAEMLWSKLPESTQQYLGKAPQ